jgi:hypothetical protein
MTMLCVVQVKESFYLDALGLLYRVFTYNWNYDPQIIIARRFKFLECDLFWKEEVLIYNFRMFTRMGPSMLKYANFFLSKTFLSLLMRPLGSPLSLTKFW